MDLAADAELMWIAKEGLLATVPDPWTQREDENNEIYFLNKKTNESMWKHPLDDYYRKMYQQEKAKRNQEKNQSAKAETDKDNDDGEESYEESESEDRKEIPVKQNTMINLPAPAKETKPINVAQPEEIIKKPQAAKPIVAEVKVEGSILSKVDVEDFDEKVDQEELERQEKAFNAQIKVLLMLPL
eukprot:TRINITY_DN14792_c0_g1_i3.p1 TRINITY_DN14792_c0_g1~~TRINITY_DN14792_c0_g1_i3.p1  ORF type:complete len:186 (-),score=53.31 TRINITY_DN14792_c0_g1_i3:696-1253(-)